MHIMIEKDETVLKVCFYKSCIELINLLLRVSCIGISVGQFETLKDMGNNPH